MLDGVGTRAALLGSRSDSEQPMVLPPAAPEQVRHYNELAQAGLSTIENHWRNALGRDGTDGRGRKAQFIIAPDFANAQADGKTATVRLGRYAPDAWYAGDLGTLNHEYAHLVIYDETTGTSGGKPARWKQLHEQHIQRRLDANGKSKWKLAAAEGRKADGFHMMMGQYWAIHEGIADVMGAALTQSWRSPNRDVEKGAGIITDFRRYKAPLSQTTDPRDDPREAHVAGGIVSDAAVDIQRKLGWEAMERIFYEVVIDDRFTDAALFRDVAKIATERAGKLYGAEAAAAVKAAFAANFVPTG